MRKQQFKQIIWQFVQQCSMKILTLKLIHKQNFDSNLLSELTPDKAIIQQIIEYLLLRENRDVVESYSTEDVVTCQTRLAARLSTQQFDREENPRVKGRIFLQKIVVLSIVTAGMLRNIKVEQEYLLEPRQIFIVLVFLASGKLVSVRTFDLAQEKMRKKKKARVHFPTSSTLQSAKQHVLQIRKPASELFRFKEELKNALRTEKPTPRRKQPKTKMLLRRNAAQLKNKMLFSQKYSVAEQSKQNLKSMTENNTIKDTSKGKVNSVSFPTRVSLDKTLLAQNVRSPSSSLNKNKTQLFALKKVSKNEWRRPFESIKRTKSVDGDQ